MPANIKNQGLNWLSNRSSFYIVFATEIGDSTSEYFFQSFQQESVMKKLEAVKWWKKAPTSAVSRGMIDLATTIVGLPASTGALERCFSTMGNIMSFKRNKLAVEKAGKLCTISNSLKVSMEELNKLSKQKQS